MVKFSRAVVAGVVPVDDENLPADDSSRKKVEELSALILQAVDPVSSSRDLKDYSHVAYIGP